MIVSLLLTLDFLAHRFFPFFCIAIGTNETSKKWSRENLENNNGNETQRKTYEMRNKKNRPDLQLNI